MIYNTILHKKILNCRKLSVIESARMVLLPSLASIPQGSLFYTENAVTIEEESILMSYLHQKLKNRKYGANHWDNVITRYREIEIGETSLPSDISIIISGLKLKISQLYGKKITFLPPHVIDLASDGFIGTKILLLLIPALRILCYLLRFYRRTSY